MDRPAEKISTAIYLNLNVECIIENKKEIEGSKDQLFILAEERDLDDNKEYIGYLKIKKNKDLNHKYVIENLTVKEERRSLGIGSAMIKYGIKVSKEKGIKNLYCKIDKEEEYLNKFYENLGFKKVEDNNCNTIIYINDLK